MLQHLSEVALTDFGSEVRAAALREACFDSVATPEEPETKMGKKRDRKPARITEYAEKEVKDLGIGSMTWVKQCPASGKTGARNAKIVSLRPLIQ